MNKPLTAAELDIAMPVTTMSRREKLFRWANIIRNASSQLRLYSNLEHTNPDWRNRAEHASTAFALAAVDPILKDAGLKSGSVGDSERFFELSLADLHSFSCDCGGTISNDLMANRIEAIATK